MAYQPAPDKRRGREHVSDAKLGVHRAQSALLAVIGETNVINVQRAVRDALDELQGAQWELNELDMLYAMRARRGSYNGSGDDEEGG